MSGVAGQAAALAAQVIAVDIQSGGCTTSVLSASTAPIEFVITVKDGSVTRYMSDCPGRTFYAGDVFVETSEMGSLVVRTKRTRLRTSQRRT